MYIHIHNTPMHVTSVLYINKLNIIHYTVRVNIVDLQVRVHL